MASDSTGIFLMQNAAAGQPTSFPRELRSRLFGKVEPRFVLLFGISLLVVGLSVYLLSFRKQSDVMTDAQILKLQERYASIVLNQPVPKPQEIPNPTEITPKAQEQAQTTEEKPAEAAPVDREKETFKERETRRVASSATRESVRQQVAAQVQSTGIFAAITATANGGGGGGVNDLLGAANGDGIADLQNLKVSKGTFAAASRGISASDIKESRGAKTSGVVLSQSAIGRASGGSIVAGGSVNITSSAPPEIKGESASSEERSMASIQKVIDREKVRLIRIYENRLKQDPELKGQIKIRFTILPTGAVASVSIAKSTMNNPEFEDMVVRFVQRWMFTPISGGGPVEVVFPFAFEGQS